MLVFAILYILITYTFCRRVYSGDDEFGVRFLAPALLVISPYAIQMSIDIGWEGGVLIFFATLWMVLCYTLLVARPNYGRLPPTLALIGSAYLLLMTNQNNDDLDVGIDGFPDFYTGMAAFLLVWGYGISRITLRCDALCLYCVSWASRISLDATGVSAPGRPNKFYAVRDSTCDQCQLPKA